MLSGILTMVEKGLDQRAAVEMELAQLHAELEAARAAETSHYVWSMAVLSPVGLLVLVNLFVTGGLKGVFWVVAFILALTVQLWQWKRRGKEVERLEDLLAEWNR